MDRRHASPLPIALAAMGTLAPLLVLWSDTTIRADRLAWGLSASVLSGLVSACVGVLLRDKTSWGAFIGTALALGTAFGTLVACATWQPAAALLIVVLPIAVACAAALTFASAGVFVAHRRALVTRAGSLLGELDRSWVLTASAFTIVLLALFVNLGSHPSTVRLAIAAAAGVYVIATALGRRRRLQKLSSILSQAGPELSERDSGQALYDLGIGDERYLLGQIADAYRSPGALPLVIQGSPVAAHFRARGMRRGDAALAAIALSILLYLAIVTLGYHPPPNEISAPPQAAVATEPLPLRTGSWYPGQEPTLVDIDHDGTDEVVSLRWDSSTPESALFVAAHDGGFFRPLWVTESVPSQWMSPDTHLVRSGSVLFLTTSERRVYFYDLETGRELRKPRGVGSTASLCAATSGEPRVWLLDAGALSDEKQPGLLLDAAGHDTPAKRPADCRPAYRVRAPLGEWDAACGKKLKKGELRVASFFKRGDVGLAISGFDATLSAVGYDPATCSRRWQSSLMLTEQAPHRSPHFSYQLADGSLYTLYQLATGEWQVGARDAKSGRVQWHQTLPQAQRGTNVEELFPGGKRVYVARDWRLDVLRVGDGRYLGQI